MLYTPEQRRRRDASPWTRVQAILAPLQFLVMLGSAVLIARYLRSGQGYEIATASVLLKTALLYLIMVTGSIWERDVFGEWLFVPAFFWEDVVSTVVVGLHTWYLWGLFLGGRPETELMWIALVAYLVYGINAIQFLAKLRRARRETSGRPVPTRLASAEPVVGGKGP